jgi:ketosteroid isomerase-like protein
VQFIREGGLETKGLVNLALTSNGAIVSVSEDNPDHPASTITNGITTSDGWNQGEGWESTYEGRFSRGGYTGYGVEDPYMAEERGANAAFDAGDSSWRGLRVQARSGSINTALGWVIIEFPEKKMVNRMIIYTIDSNEYPAAKFGVRDLALQYWNDVVSSWASVDRVGKGMGQTGNAIHNNESGVVTYRFQPVETPKMRLIIRWTNDSREYKRGYYMHTSGTIRLTEVEIYGYESEKETEEQATPIAVTQDANKIMEIGIVIDNYVDAYNRQNADMLMSSVSPDYLRDGETYSDLRKKMESIFSKYEKLELKLENAEIALTTEGARATSTYNAKYGATADGAAPVTVSGSLIFQLSDATGYWKITRIDSR